MFLLPIPLKNCNSGSTLSIINPHSIPNIVPIESDANSAIAFEHSFFRFQTMSATISIGKIINVGEFWSTSWYLNIIYDRYANVNPKTVWPIGKVGMPSIKLHIGLCSIPAGWSIIEPTTNRFRKHANKTPAT